MNVSIQYVSNQKKKVETCEGTPLICFRVYRVDGKGTKHVMSCSLLASSLLPHSLLEGMPALSVFSILQHPVACSPADSDRQT